MVLRENLSEFLSFFFVRIICIFWFYIKTWGLQFSLVDKASDCQSGGAGSIPVDGEEKTLLYSLGIKYTEKKKRMRVIINSYEITT